MRTPAEKCSEILFIKICRSKAKNDENSIVNYLGISSFTAPVSTRGRRRSGIQGFCSRTQKLCSFWVFFRCGTPKPCSFCGVLQWNPEPCALSYVVQTLVMGNPATPGRSGGLVHPKTIRLPEVCSTLIPVFLDGAAKTSPSADFAGGFCLPSCMN